MRLLICLFTAVLVSLFSIAQDNVQGDISTKDTAELTILGVYPEDFPKVSVVFRAEKNSGEPVFGLGIKDMQVSENGQACEVVSICGLSEQKPISIGLVIDHSGSMLYDEMKLFELGVDPWFLYVDDDGNPIFPDGYEAPLDIAKSAVSEFVASFNFNKDQMSVVGFSTQVDKVLALTNNRSKIDAMVSSMKADSMTAFYDALMVGIDQVKEGKGLNVLVALTDGNDNSSGHNIHDVIDHANEVEVPIYIIGLGDVNTDSLQMIAIQTKGQFYYASSASALQEIYEKISEKLQAFYDMVYLSPNLASADGSRDLRITFEKDNIYVITEDEKLELPQEIITILRDKEKEASERQWLIWGGSAGALLLVGGFTFFFLRRKKERLAVKLYPNPSNGIINIDTTGTELMTGQLQIFNAKGESVFSGEIGVQERNIDLTFLGRGAYNAIVIFGSQKTTEKFVIS